MSVHIEQNAKNDIVYITLSGVVSPQECADIIERIIVLKEYPPDTPRVWDLRELDFQNTDSSLVQELVQLRSKLPESGQGRVACVVEGDLAYGMMRMYQTMSDDLPQKIMLFRSMHDAEKWMLDR